MFELIAHKSELTVDIIAVKIAQIIKINIHGGHNFASKMTNGFSFSAKFIDLMRAMIPKYIGMLEKIIRNIAAKNAEIVAVIFVFAAKNF